MNQEDDVKDPRGRKPFPVPSVWGWLLILPLFWLSGPLARWFCHRFLPVSWQGERAVWLVWMAGLAVLVLLLRRGAKRVAWLFRHRRR